MDSPQVNNGEQANLETPAGVVHDLLDRHEKTSTLFWRCTAALAVLSIIGMIGFILRILDGVSDKSIWGYYVATFAFILTTAQAAPMVAIAPRIAKAHWRRSISRAAELWSATGILSLILFIPMIWILPGLDDGRLSLWFFDPNAPSFSKVPIHSPQIWATLALVALIITGIFLLWVSALPDLAAMRDNLTGWRQRLATKMAFGWRGTSQQWNMLYHRQGILSAFYFMMLIFVHFLISVDFLMTLVPGWIDALYPATHAANALQAGAATMLLTMFFLRKFGGYRSYIGHDQFWGLGKLMFALSLLWFWFWFSSFIVFWYGKKPNEQAVLELLMVGPYMPIFIGTFVTVFVIPLLTMIWNPLRRSIWGPTIIAVSVLVGTFLDRVRLYVSAYSVPGIGEPLIDKKHGMKLESVKEMEAVLPQIPDIFIIIGSISAVILIYLLASRIIPVINIWEQREILLYKVHKKFFRTEVMILGKKD